MTDQPAKNLAPDTGASDSPPTTPEAVNVWSYGGILSGSVSRTTYVSDNSGSQAPIDPAAVALPLDFASFEPPPGFVLRTPDQRKADGELLAQNRQQDDRAHYYDPSVGRWVPEEPPPTPPDPAAP